MIVRRQKRHDPERHVLLRCDGRNCTEHEQFDRGTDFAAISTWITKNGWRTIHRGGHLWDHRCPKCERLLRAPADYFDRLHAD